MTRESLPPIDPQARRLLELSLISHWHPAALDEARQLLADYEPDWDALLRFAVLDGLAPLLHDRLRQRAVLPAAVAQRLEEIYRHTAITCALHAQELDQVLDRLAAAAVPVILLKGAALVEWLYDNPALRPMADLDLLTHPADAPQAQQVLAALDYEPVDAEPHAGFLLAYESELAFRKAGPPGTLVELHWHLLDSPYYQERLDEAWFWQTAQPLPGRPAGILRPEANLLYLSAHLMLHHQGTGLRWLHDIAMLVLKGGDMDWQAVQRRACDFHMVTPLQRVLATLADAWRVPLPAGLLEQVQALPVSEDEQRAVAALLVADPPVAQRFWADLSAMPGWRRRVPFALAQLFPTAGYMRSRYRLPHPLLLPLAYPYRWTLGLWQLLASRRAPKG